eukprot:gene9711-8298_t
MPDHITGTLDKQNYCMEWNSTGPIGWMAKFGYNAGSYVEGKGCPAKYGKDITKSFVKAHSKDFDSKVVRVGPHDKAGATMG